MRPICSSKWTALYIAMAWIGAGCAHTQPPAQKAYVISEDTSGIESSSENGTGGASAEAYCNELEKQCFKQCWRRKPKTTSIPKGSDVHHEYCTSKCLEVFTQCVKDQEELERQESTKRELHFPTTDAALSWLREHKTEAVIGTIVIVGGVIAAPYVIAIAGGALILAPL